MQAIAIVLAARLAQPAVEAEPTVEPGAAPAAEPAAVSETEPALPALLPDPLAGARGLDPDGLVAAEAAAYRLYMRGSREHEARKWAEAERTFDEALRTLPDDRAYERSRGALALWWALSHGRLYDTTGDLAMHERETAILKAYRERVPAIATSNEDRAHKTKLVDERLAEIDRETQRRTGDHGDADTQLEKSMAGEYEGVTTSVWRPDLITDLGWVARRDDPRLRAQQEEEHETAGDDDDPNDDGSTRRPGLGLVIGGAVAMAAGIGGLGVMGAGMAKASRANDFDAMQSPMQRREQIATGLDANSMAIAGAVTGSVLLVTGIVLTVVGAKKMKKNKRGPSAHAWGLGLAGRF